MKRHIVFFILCMTLIQCGLSQCPNAAFTIPDTVCAGEKIFPVNTSTNSNTYYWDFSSGDLISSPNVSSLGTLGNAFNNPSGISIVNDGVNWFGFVKNLGTSKLTRLDFGNSLNNVPSAVDLGNPGGLLGSSFGRFGFHYEHGNWYALTTNVGALIKLDFGNSLTNVPTASALPSYGLLNNSRDLFLTFDKDTIYAFIANFVSNNISVYKFDSISGNIIDYFNITAVADSGFASGLYSVAAIKDCDKWIALTGGFNDNNIARLNFNGAIHSKPLADQLGNLGTVNNPTAIHIKSENATWVAYVENRSNMGLTRIVFPDSLMTQNPQSVSLGTFGNLLLNTDALDMTEDSSKWFAFGMNKSTNSLIEIAFPEALPAMPLTDTSASPSVVYNAAGTYYITLTAKDINTKINHFHDSIVVKERPHAGFATSGICKGQTTLFTDTSTSVSNLDFWKWYFGDGDSSFLQNPAHLFSDTGVYTTVLIVSNTEGCFDTVSQSVSIVSKPVAGFSMSAFCTDYSIYFTDTSSVVSDTINAWNWSFGTSDTALVQHPVYVYDSGGYYNVRLICTTSNGCKDTSMHMVHINESPWASFTVQNTCKTDSTVFINTSSIDSGMITNYIWYFGDGDSAAIQNPLHLFPDTGNYSVTLIAISDSGCVDSAMHTVGISMQPIPGFSFSPVFVCENSPVAFYDTSIVPGGDTTTAWVWDFGTGDSSFVKNPTYTFTSSGIFNVTLSVTSGTDCDSSITIPVNVNPAPAAAFSASGFCIGDSTFFTDQSSGNIIDWKWDFGDSAFSTDTNASHLYTDTGAYIISLIITSSTGCTNQTADTLRIHALPQAAFINSPACSNSPVTFTDFSTSADDSLTYWIWHFDDPGSGSYDTSYLKNPTHTYTSQGVYNVEHIVFTVSGCVDTVKAMVTVLPSPLADFSTDTVCDGVPVSFSDESSGNITDWYWDFGSGNPSTDQNPTHLYDSAGTYYALLTVQDLNGCMDTVSKSVHVLYNPVPGFYVQYPCAYTTATFHDTSKVINSSIAKWSWAINIDTFSVPDPVYTFQDTVLYIVGLRIYSEQGCTDTLSQLIKAHISPTTDFSYTPLFGVPPLNVHFTNLSSNADTYQWSFGDNQVSSETNPYHTYTDTGVYSIQLLSLNQFGCRDSLNRIIKIMDPVLDVAVIQVEKKFNSGYLSVSADLANLGTRDVFSFDVSVSITDGSTIKESWNGYLASGDIMTYPFAASFEIPSETDPEYICVEVSNPEGETDDVPENNEQCITSENMFLMMDIKPNPVNSNVEIKYIIPAKDHVDVYLYNSIGQIVEILFSGISASGLNAISYMTDELSSGTYAIRVTYRHSSEVKRFIKITR